jgi:putative nucleotidyltransferase with HDIG domain
MFEFIKRARLHREGLSCGRYRRTTAQGEFREALSCHPFVGIFFFAVAGGLSILLIHLLSAHLPWSNGVKPVFLCAIFITSAVHWYLGFYGKSHKNRDILLTFGIIALQLAAVALILGYGSSSPRFALLLAPHALAPVMLCMLGGRPLGLYTTVYATLLGASLVEPADALAFVAVGLSVGFIAVFASQSVRKRSRLITCGFYAGLVATLYMVLFGELSTAYNLDGRWFMLGAPLLCGVLTTMVAGALLPALEAMFHLTTDISWLELADLNHPLMKRLSMEAPGTYHHSLMVANLSEAAAEAIKANPGMCRVCSYFHDIGKLTKPEYFIENLGTEENPHDDLTARMSALVLIAHVKDGVDLALKHGLNRRIIEVIEQHHGTSLVYFFYRRALEQKNEMIRLVEQDKAREDDVPDVTEDGFRYPGPKPQSKEAAIISLADSIESASRTIGKPTPARVEQLVDEIVRNRVLDGQLDECDLTLAQIAQIKDSFVKTLLSMMHSRIRYPKEHLENEPVAKPGPAAVHEGEDEPATSAAKSAQVSHAA